MNNQNVLAMDRSRIISAVWVVTLVGVAMLAPLLHQQLITGTIVNATLFVAAIILGRRMGIMVGIIPSVIALTVGTLPAVLAPMVPYIMLSNALLILVFIFLKDKNYWLAVCAASFSKFIFLYMVSAFVFGVLTQKVLATMIAQMMSWPQLITALAGGTLAWIVYYKKAEKGYK
ncbi:MAG TPA: hypothetical protein P5323_01165 [Candidatus Moranbacteria bacterium]|nr:hypothetical protein [Candidatus Moranbacteria bacterium]HRY27723.1 hypothetical protein [Candidatus Moranbacteria bacterium]HSA08520.1 hypothetical protein [Candidatus Moranbacteria bacterium]